MQNHPGILKKDFYKVKSPAILCLFMKLRRLHPTCVQGPLPDQMSLPFYLKAIAKKANLKHLCLYSSTYLVSFTKLLCADSGSPFSADENKIDMPKMNIKKSSTISKF